jgi:hypothetical protein
MMQWAKKLVVGRLYGRKHAALSELILWSNLAKIGNATAMKLTVLVPFIGVFLLFNQQTEQLFKLPEFFKSDLGISSGHSFSVTNLYFTYFGLCFLGASSFVFAIFCPTEIALEPNSETFALNSTSSETPVLAKASSRRVLGLHFENEFDEKKAPNPENPPDLEGDFHSLMEELYTTAILEKQNEGSDLEGNTSDDGMPDVMNGAGYLDEK